MLSKEVMKAAREMTRKKLEPWKEAFMELLKEEQVKEKCVVCNQETPYTKDTHVDYRQYYVEGAGQLCEDCYFRIYLKGK